MKRTEAVTTLASLDVRRAPSHASELRSQLLLGERVRLLGADPRRTWMRVESLCDGYRGWARSWGLRELRPEESGGWERRRRMRVGVRYAEVRERPGSGALLTPVFWGSRLEPVETRRRWTRVALPDGRSGWVANSALEPNKPSRRPLESIVSDLWGVPYLWGGRTPLGFDCSGFVQQVLRMRGRWVPRDAREQFAACRPISPGRAREGDLVFFGPPGKPPGHVGLVLAGSRYAHARGSVRLSSTDPDSALYDKDLGETIRGFGRPGREEAPGRHSC
jgi:SH3-like domain-containing protein